MMRVPFWAALAVAMGGLLWILQAMPVTARSERSAAGEVTAFGTVVLPRQVRPTFGSAGIVGQIKVGPGERVREGQVLALLADYESRVLTAKSAVRDDEVALENARRSLIATQNSDAVARTVRDRENERNFAEVQYGEGLRLRELGQIAEGELNKRLSDLLTAKERLEAARQNGANALATAQNNVAKAEENLRRSQRELEFLRAGVEVPTQRSPEEVADAIIHAPFDGVVDVVLVTVGQEVGTSTAILVLVDPSVAQVSAQVEETDVAAVAAGSPARVSIAALADVELAGTVGHVSLSGITQAGAVRFTVTVLLSKPLPAGLRGGMTALVEIVGSGSSSS